MEFPDLGKHCSEKACKRLDFLPLKCDACKQDFCKHHFTYAAHKCPLAFTKDVRVPVCPLCNSPVPVRRGESPDVAVGAHMDGDCRRPPGQETPKVFTFRCSREGCRRREMLRVACEECDGSFCLQHRHPLDHGCARRGHPGSLAGCLEPRLSGSSREGLRSWLARRFRPLVPKRAALARVSVAGLLPLRPLTAGHTPSSHVAPGIGHPSPGGGGPPPLSGSLSRCPPAHRS